MTTIRLEDSLHAAYLTLIEQRYGLRLAERQAALVDQLVQQMLAATSCTTPADLYQLLLLGAHADVFDSQIATLTIGETHFFRVTPQIEILRSVVLPDLLRRHATDRQLRLWSAGCSTGEEPYTLAMLIREQLPLADDWTIELLATDISQPALEIARQGRYGDWSFRDTPDWVRGRYFSPTGSRWQIAESVRRMVQFANFNLASDAFPPSPFKSQRLDLILCRNVAIYFSPATTREVFQHFGRVLTPHGWLVLGPSDPVPDPASGLVAVLLDGAVLWQRAVASIPVVVPQRAPPQSTPILARVDRPARLTPLKQHRPRPAAPVVAPDHLRTGLALLEVGDAEAAIESLRRAAFIDPSNAFTQFTLGRAYRQQGNVTRARASLTWARRLLANQLDHEQVPESDVAVGALRHAVDRQLEDLDRGGTAHDRAS